MTTTFTGTDVAIRIPDGELTDKALAPNAAIDPTKMAQRVLQEYPVPLTTLRVHDNFAALLPGTAAADDLGLTTGTWGTDAPQVDAGDLKAAGATTRYAAFEVQVPPNFENGETIQLRITAGMETTVADTSCTVDVECYLPDGSGGVGTDLCSTSAQSMNSLTEDAFDFTLSGGSINPGDLLGIRVAVACNDAATGTAVTPVIYDVRLLCDTRGG